MRFVLQTPTLEHLVGVKIVAAVWNHLDILTILLPFDWNFLSEEMAGWTAIQERVRSSVSALPLPELCKERLFPLIKPLGVEIIAWYRYHGRTRNTLANYLWLQHFRWTMRGTVDYAKTAEIIAKDERVDVERRYEFACINSLEEEARELFTSMGEERRCKYTCKNDFKIGLYEILVDFFTRAINGRSPWSDESSINLNKCIFQDALRNGDPTICEYLFMKFSRREKNRVLTECDMLVASCSSKPSCGLYYLSLLNEEQQELMFRRGCSLQILMCLLGWPLQSLFVEMAECGWHLMSKRDCAKVLNAIFLKIQRGFGDYDYYQLFRECWRLSPADYRRFCLYDFNILKGLFVAKREEFVKLILNEASSAQFELLFRQFRHELLDESAVSDAALVECRETAVVASSNAPGDEELRLRSEHLSRLVDFAMESRKKQINESVVNM